MERNPRTPARLVKALERDRLVGWAQEAVQGNGEARKIPRNAMTAYVLSTASPVHAKEMSSLMGIGRRRHHVRATFVAGARLARTLRLRQQVEESLGTRRF